MFPVNRIIWVRPHGLHAKNKFSCRHETILWFAKTKNYKFNLYYKNNSNDKKIFSVTNLTFNTRLGLIEAIRL